MRATPALALRSASTDRQPQPPRWPARALARVRGHQVDTELAAGTVPWRTPVHAARALQLTSRRCRRSLAASLEDVAEQVQAPTPAALQAAVPASPSQGREAMPLILQIAAQLRAVEPVDARGMAAVRLMLCDGSGPFYVSGPPGALKEALEDIARWLTTSG